MDFYDFDNYDTVNWKLKIPKKLYNKVKYYLNAHGCGIDRDYFFNTGVDELTLKNEYNQDFSEPQYLYRFSDEDEANLVTWQFRVGKRSLKCYKEFMAWYGYSARDVLAASLYYYKGC